MLSQNSGKNGVANAVVSVGALTPHPRNYNQHSQAQVGDLRRSLRRFGQVRSIVVQAQADRELAALAAGSEARLTEMLATLDTTQGDAEPQIDRAAELLEKWQVRLGDLWRIGEHRLACGDCTDKAVVERVMGGEKAGACVTDPPYGQNQAGVTNDAPEQLQGIITGAITNLPVVDAVVLAFSSPRTFPVWLDTARAVGHKFERMLWLYKAAQETFPWRGWLLKSESILVTSVGNGQWQDVHPYSHDCYYKSEVSGQLAPNSGWHGSVKPLDVVQDLIARVSLVGGLVIDPFLGSGTTLVACQNLHRRGRGIEISPEYCSVVLERMATAFPGIEIERLLPRAKMDLDDENGRK